ncbi:MAG: hypothetical protein GF308_17800 [Candidatus Heimdallarchaeota archaeon]|nr:hypothetical protein [Candidatus Heimdallarchaeota archaeon]
MAIEEFEEETDWFHPWTKKSLGWAILCFILLAGVNGGFTVFFDIVLTGIGFIYVYFSLLFFTGILYFFYVWLRVKWLGIFSFGLCGLIGIPIEWWLEWKIAGTLKSPWFAVGWGTIFAIYGIVADLSFWLLKPHENETRAVLLSALIFSLMLIVISIIPLSFFYKPSTEETAHFLTFWYFLIPFGIVEGVIGAFAGMHLAHDLRRKQKPKQ